MSTSIPAKMVMPSMVLVGFANALNVCQGALVIEAVGEGQILGVVGDGHVFVAARLGGFSHFFDGVLAVGFDGVHVHVALKIVKRDQSGQRVFFRGIDLAQIFAQLGRNVIELELGVDLFFALAGDRLLGFEIGEAVFVEGVTHLEGALAQGNVVAFDPVKYCMAAPNDSGGSRRTSTCMPLRKRKLILLSP
jgi:hypothetical protein